MTFFFKLRGGRKSRLESHDFNIKKTWQPCIFILSTYTYYIYNLALYLF